MEALSQQQQPASSQRPEQLHKIPLRPLHLATDLKSPQLTPVMNLPPRISPDLAAMKLTTVVHVGFEARV